MDRGEEGRGGSSSSPSSSKTRRLRVALIGAGPCGLSQLRAFSTDRGRNDANTTTAPTSTLPPDIVDIVCFEKQSDWGGLWNTSWRTGTDEFGEAVHGSMYKFLWSNAPKECLEYADYSFEEHFGRPMPSFLPRTVMTDYIKGRASQSDGKHGGSSSSSWSLRDLIRFNTVVRNVTYYPKDEKDDDGFVVVSENLQTRTRSTERFDYVVVATGHFSVPNVPTFEGIESFPGRILHSHDFRDAREFADRDVLVIGSSFSAEDIALQCIKYGAKSVTATYGTKPMGFRWPDKMDERPLLESIEDSLVRFGDGSCKTFHAIIMCTGYLHHFPFLDDPLKLRTNNRLYPPGLYKGIAWIPNPKLLYLGMQNQFYSFTMFDIQAWWARDVILGRIILPPLSDREADAASWVRREERLQNPPEMIDFQADYLRDLIPHIDYPKFDVDLTVRDFVDWGHDKDENIMTYRDKCFRSPVTGTMSPSHSRPWFKATDDSIEAFMGTTSSSSSPS